MQLKIISIMQDDGCDANADDDSAKALSDSKLVVIDCADIIPRYCDISPLGCGANSLVFSAIDQNSQRRVAVKKVVLKPTTSLTVLKRLFREIRVLRQLDHDNVVKIYHTLVSTRRKNSGSPLTVPGAVQQDNLSCPTPLSVDSMYIGMEMMDTDLNSILLQQRLVPGYIKLFLYQLLRGVKYIHSANVIHRDVTPSNIFINVDTLMLKIGDFGVCRIYDDEYDHCGHLSMASASTHYQAPELILRPKHYSKAIDVWSVGCVFAAMIGGKPFFNGDSSLDQINLMLNSVAVTPMCWDSVVGGGCTDRRCCPDPSMYETRDNGGHPNFPLRDALPQASLMAINLLQQLLTFDPRDRITAADALMHRYLSPYTQSSDEPTCLQPFHLEDELDHDVTPASCQQYLLSEAGKFASFDSNYVETSNEDALSSRRGSRTSMSLQVDSCKNLVSLVQSTNISHSSTHSALISESEARTIACDLDYGVQITDGSVKRERTLDFEPIQSTADCFDPYKWDHHDDKDKQADMNPQTDVTNDERHDDPIHSDHGYSSYCSSNISHGRTHPHSMWSLSSPDLSVDLGGNHRASAPEMGELLALAAVEGDGHISDTRPSPTIVADDKPPSDPRRRHKDDVPRHHHSYHHHHHHHHHHKHHRHSGRHGSSSAPQQPQTSHEVDSAPPSNGRRHCVVTDVVLEEEGSLLEVTPQEETAQEPVIPSTKSDDLSKPKAPSEHLSDASFHPESQTFALLPEEGRNITTSRSRARSDGSQCRRPGLVPFNNNLFEQFRLAGQVPENTNGIIKNSLLTPLCFPSLAPAELGGSLTSLTRYRPLVPPQKCASGDQKPAVHPFKQVECPF